MIAINLPRTMSFRRLFLRRAQFYIRSQPAMPTAHSRGPSRDNVLNLVTTATER